MHLLLMLGISAADILSYPGVSAAEGKLGILIVHGIRIALAIPVVVCIVNSRRTELMVMTGTRYALKFDVTPTAMPRCTGRCGIEYVDDPLTKKKIATCHRTQFKSILDDPDYETALAHAA